MASLNKTYTNEELANEYYRLSLAYIDSRSYKGHKSIKNKIASYKILISEFYENNHNLRKIKFPSDIKKTLELILEYGAEITASLLEERHKSGFDKNNLYSIMGVGRSSRTDRHIRISKHFD